MVNDELSGWLVLLIDVDNLLGHQRLEGIRCAVVSCKKRLVHHYDERALQDGIELAGYRSHTVYLKIGRAPDPAQNATQRPLADALTTDQDDQYSGLLARTLQSVRNQADQVVVLLLVGAADHIE